MTRTVEQEIGGVSRRVGMYEYSMVQQVCPNIMYLLHSEIINTNSPNTQVRGC